MKMRVLKYLRFDEPSGPYPAGAVFLKDDLIEVTGTEKNYLLTEFPGHFEALTEREELLARLEELDPEG